MLFSTGKLYIASPPLTVIIKNLAAKKQHGSKISFPFNLRLPNIKMIQRRKCSHTKKKENVNFRHWDFDFVEFYTVSVVHFGRYSVRRYRRQNEWHHRNLKLRYGRNLSHKKARSDTFIALNI